MTKTTTLQLLERTNVYANKFWGGNLGKLAEEAVTQWSNSLIEIPVKIVDQI